MMAIVRPDRAALEREATFYGYQPTTLEQVHWLLNLLGKIFSHPYLKGRLVLKGGTALNLFYLPLPRLSVDIDLNYIGHLDKEAMEQERPQVEVALEQLFRSMNLQIQRGRPEHAATTYTLRFPSVLGGVGQIQVEVNWLMRVCLLPPMQRTSKLLSFEPTVTVLAPEELMGGKMKAFLERGAGRDLFDLFQMTQGNITVDRTLWRKVTIAFFSTVNEQDLARQRGIRRRDLRALTVDDVLVLDEQRVRTSLEPVLPADSMPPVTDMVQAVAPLVSEVLSWDERERSYMDALLDEGEVYGDLLFPDYPDLAERWQRHPAIQWKAQNVRKVRRRHEPK